MLFEFDVALVWRLPRARWSSLLQDTERLDVTARQDITQSDEISYLGCSASKNPFTTGGTRTQPEESKTQMWCRSESEISRSNMLYACWYKFIGGRCKSASRTLSLLSLILRRGISIHLVRTQRQSENVTVLRNRRRELTNSCF